MAQEGTFHEDRRSLIEFGLPRSFNCRLAARLSPANSATKIEAVPTAVSSKSPLEQRNFLTHIADEIGANAALETDDLDHGTLKSRDGLPRALALFGRERLPGLLEELNTALAV
jgi:hypothetical protein